MLPLRFGCHAIGMSDWNRDGQKFVKQLSQFHISHAASSAQRDLAVKLLKLPIMSNVTRGNFTRYYALFWNLTNSFSIETNFNSFRIHFFKWCKKVSEIHTMVITSTGCRRIESLVCFDQNIQVQKRLPAPTSQEYSVIFCGLAGHAFSQKTRG